jgi:hypothetical protein
MRYNFPHPTDLSAQSIKFEVTDFDGATFLYDVKVQAEGS